MKHFRNLIAALDSSGELLKINKPVDARYELSALLKQAESRRKAVVFHSVDDKSFPVVAGLLTTAQRMALALGRSDAATFTRKQHADLIRDAISNPITSAQIKTGPCKEVIHVDEQVNCESLPVPTFFADDTGPFLTAAVGIARNPENGVLNVGMYRILMLDNKRVAVSASPSSDLFRFMEIAREQGKTIPVAIIMGPDPALLMAAAAKVPANISELDVAGALNGQPLEVVPAETSDLLVPAHAEIVLEVEVEPSETIVNKMGEFGDFYGEQNAPVATVNALTHRKDAILHAIMAGAGREHNSIGFIILYEIEPALKRMLADSHPAVSDVRVHFEPPRMGVLGDVYLKLEANAKPDVDQLIEDVFAIRLGALDIARVIRRIVVVDHDIDIQQRREIDWAISTRANTVDQIELCDDLPAAMGKVRIGINATANVGEREQFKRLEIPGADKVSLDDYLD